MVPSVVQTSDSTCGVVGGPARVRPRASRRAARSAACALLLLVPAAPYADDFSGFRIPDNRALLWDARLSTAARSSDFNRPGTEFSAGSVNVNLSSAFQWFSDSDPAFTSVFMSASAFGDRSHTRAELQRFDPTRAAIQIRDGSDRTVDDRWEVTASHRRYPWALPLGFEVAAAAAGTYWQRWSSRTTDAVDVNAGSTYQTLSVFSNEIRNTNDGVTGNVSAGWGRIRNATGVYDALVLERRIRETGALTRPLSTAARRRLAELLYARGHLDTVRERPGRSLWSEVERILREDGALGDRGFEPFSVLRGEEPHLGASVGLTADGMPVSPVTRLRGGFLGVRLFGTHTHLKVSQESASSFQTITNGFPTPPLLSDSFFESSQTHDDLEGGVTGEFHRPLGVPLQLDASGLAQAGLRAEDNFLLYDANAALSWLVADRWTATAGARYNGRDDDRTTGPTAGDRWAFNAALSAIYYLEDRVAIELTASQEQNWNRGQVDAPPPSPEAHHFDRTLSATLGLTYRFAGWFQMPAFFPAPGTGVR